LVDRRDLLWGRSEHFPRDGELDEPDLLRSAYSAAFALAAEQRAATVAAPSISTGIYGFPIDLAAPIALREASTALTIPATPLREITFALFSGSDLEVFSEALQAL
jgi:O-acetyl-ADP-ribose deacetylase